MWRRIVSIPPSVSWTDVACGRWTIAARMVGSSGSASFRGPSTVGAGRVVEHDANPYKSWEHLNHKMLAMMCIGCLFAGIAAGHYAEVDEALLKPTFDRDAVIEDALKTFEFRPDLAATSIRVAFLMAARRAGRTAASVDESCALTEGLDDIAGVLNFLANRHHASMEDIATLVTLAAVKFLRGPYEEVVRTWRWGRKEEEKVPDSSEVGGGGEDVAKVSLPALLHEIAGLTEEESVALMASHSVGEYHAHVSGVDDASRTGRCYSLSNEYYQFLLKHEKSFSPLEVMRTADNKAVEHLPRDLIYTYVTVAPRQNGDAVTSATSKRKQCVFTKREVGALLHSRTLRQYVDKFAKDEQLWRKTYAAALSKLLDSHFEGLRPYVRPK